MKPTTFHLKVYDKGVKTHEAWKTTLLVAVPVFGILLIGILFFTNEELDDSIPFLVILSMGFIVYTVMVILRMIDGAQSLGSVGEIFTLYINERSILYLQNEIPFSSIVSVTVEITENTKSRFRGNNNFLTIKTRQTEFNLGLVIENKVELIQADKMAEFLRSKKVPVEYDRFVMMNFN